MNHCKGRCLILAIAQGKVGEEIGDGSSRRKYCGMCEIYFGLSVEVLSAGNDINNSFNMFDTITIKDSRFGSGTMDIRTNQLATFG